MADGHLNKCKNCTKKAVRKNYRKNKDHYRKYDAVRAMLPHRVKARNEYAKTEQGRKARQRATATYREKHPEKSKAVYAVSNAVRDGRLIKKPCVFCGKKRVHGHHCDYSKPLDVVWLCSKHHVWVHRLVENRTIDYVSRDCFAHHIQIQRKAVTHA
jgi:hypothetical protein